MSCVWGCMCVMFVNDHPGKLAPSLALYPRLLYGSTHVAFHRALVQVTDVEGAGLFFFCWIGTTRFVAMVFICTQEARHRKPHGRTDGPAAGGPRVGREGPQQPGTELAAA